MHESFSFMKNMDMMQVIILGEGFALPTFCILHFMKNFRAKKVLSRRKMGRRKRVEQDENKFSCINGSYTEERWDDIKESGKMKINFRA